MAKFKYSQNLSNSIEFESSISLNISQKNHKAVWTDDDTGAQIIMQGKGFKVSQDDDDQLSAGTIDKFVLTDSHDKVVVTVTNLSVKAVKIQELWEEQGPYGVAAFLTKGNDRVIGSKEDDWLIGSTGNDVMTGKGGSDTFMFQYTEPTRAAKVKHESDVITDFDIKGPDKDYLWFDQEFTAKGVHKGHDTLLTFEDHSTLLLDGVKKAAFMNYYHDLEM